MDTEKLVDIITKIVKRAADEAGLHSDIVKVQTTHDRKVMQAMILATNYGIEEGRRDHQP